MNQTDAELMAYIDRELTPEEMQNVESRLAQSEELAQEHSELAQIANVLRTETAAIPVSGLADTIAAIKAGSPQTPEARAKRPTSRFLTVGFAAAVVVVIMAPTMLNFNPFSTAREDSVQSERAGRQLSAKSVEVPASVSAATASPELMKSKAMDSPAAAGLNQTEDLYSQPNVGPVLPPSKAPAGPGPSRAPGSGEQPLLALKAANTDQDPFSPQPPTAMAGQFRGPTVPLAIQPLPMAEAMGGAIPGSGGVRTLAALESEVRGLVAGARGAITGTSRANGGSRITFTVPGSAASAVIQAMSKSLGSLGQIEAAAKPMAREAMKASAAVRDEEPSLDQLQAKLADQQKSREDLLKDFYEDARPIKTIDAEIAETKRKIDQKKKALGDQRLSYVVTLKPGAP